MTRTKGIEIMRIAPESMVTVYSDVTAFVICLGLLLLSKGQMRDRDKRLERLFGGMVFFLMINSITNAASYALHFQNTGWPMPVRMILPTIAELSVLYTMFAWLLYVDYKIYGLWDRIIRLYRYWQIPVIVFTVFGIINIFTGFMFVVDENMLFIGKPPYYVLLFLQYFYGLYPALLLVRFVKNNGNTHFFHLWPTVVPAAVSALFTSFTPYSARALGFTIALVFLYFSYINRWRFDDLESGFYNKHYARWLAEMADDKHFDYHSAIFINVESPGDELYKLLKAELPLDGEIIRMKKNRFVIFSESGSTSFSKLLASAYQEEADRYPIEMTVAYTIREKQQSSADFIRMVTTE